MNIIAGTVGGIVGAILALAIRLIVNHPVAALAAIGTLIALAKGVPGPVIAGALIITAAVARNRR